MGRYKGAVCKLCRREGAKLFLKGDRCGSAKCSFAKRSTPPGQHGGGRMTRLSEYGIRLREKQKAKRIYGLTERQFRKYFEEASASKGITGERFLQLLERRLDNVIYRFGFAASRKEARELIGHGHVKVDGGQVDIASYLVKAGQTIGIKDKSQERVKLNLEKNGEKLIPTWLLIDKDKLEGKIQSMPGREDIDTLIEEHLIVEYYSR